MLLFVQPYTVNADDVVTAVVDLDNPLPSKGADLPCAAAIEFMADIYESEGGNSTLKATEVCMIVFYSFFASLKLISSGHPSQTNTTQYGRSKFLSSKTIARHLITTSPQILGVPYQGRIAEGSNVDYTTYYLTRRVIACS